ncbi:MAG: hypothetical protein COA57_16490 [Flavobacteriales bacterium]|nr:MAG: hypothetical protein COA57_16490 [Flavobacteriales bacterium]
MRKLFLIISAFAVIFNSCKKEFDSPPENTIPTGGIMTIADLKALQTAENKNHKFTGDSSVYCVVTMDEVSGNIYKNVYVQDGTGAINLRLLSSGGLYEGDSIRIYLKGTVLGVFNGVLQIDSIDVDANIIKQATQKDITPAKLDSIPLINSNWQSYLVQLDNVQFAGDELGQTYADAANQKSENQMLEDCNGDQIIVRTSGFASFADAVLPTGKGSVIGVVSEFNGDMQLYIRRTSEVTLSGTRCFGSGNYLSKDFEDGSVTSGGWVNYWTGTTTGGTNWGEWEIFGGDVVSCGNFDFNTFTNYATTSWLISPAVDLSIATSPVLTFDNTYRYTGAQLQLYVSTDYPGSGDPATSGTWTNLSSQVTWNNDDSSWDFTPSGNIDLTTYKSSATYIAFKYTGTDVDGSTWEVDNILIKEN